MAFEVEDPEVERLARALASVTGLSVSEAVVMALREQLKREAECSDAGALCDELREISDRCGSLPDLDIRSPEAIFGFDAHGLPR